jgi:hypothetical protein
LAATLQKKGSQAVLKVAKCVPKKQREQTLNIKTGEICIKIIDKLFGSRGPGLILIRISDKIFVSPDIIITTLCLFFPLLLYIPCPIPFFCTFFAPPSKWIFSSICFVSTGHPGQSTKFNTIRWK